MMKKVLTVRNKAPLNRQMAPYPLILLISLGFMFIGLFFNIFWVGLPGSLVSFCLSLRVLLPSLKKWIVSYLSLDEKRILSSFIGAFIGFIGLCKYLGVYDSIANWLHTFKYDEFGSWAEWVGAVGQISIAVLAVYVAWAQYVISRELTTQQNRITQQQTIDSYFQGVSDLALNQEGMLEDWPQERAIAEGRTAAILSTVDEKGKAQVLRFLSRSRLLTPLLRDQRLGRPILDGDGGYAEDRSIFGVRVINLGVMLAKTYLSGQDLRWTDLSEANMVGSDLSKCELVSANLSRTILYKANLSEADFKKARLFYGSETTATPCNRENSPDYDTGAYTGAVVEGADFTGVKNLSDKQRYYCCAWCGEKSRFTIPGGCEDIPNLLGR